MTVQASEVLPPLAEDLIPLPAGFYDWPSERKALHAREVLSRVEFFVTEGHPKAIAIVNDERWKMAIADYDAPPMDSVDLSEIEPVGLDGSLIFVPNSNPDWVEHRGHKVAAHLTSKEIPSVAIGVIDKRVEWARLLVEHCNPGIVINRGFAIGADVVEILAEEMPSVIFLTVCHSSQSHLLHARSWLRSQNEFIALTSRKNVWYGTPDERNLTQWLCPRSIWFPNFVPNVLKSMSNEPRRFPTVSLIGRADIVKNWPNQLIALAIVNQTHPIHALLSQREDDGDQLTKMLEQGRVSHELVPWSPWENYLAFVRDRVDICLQCSFTESFNYIALEHMQLGKPAVVSPAIRYGLCGLMANPDDPAVIACRILEAIENYGSWSERCFDRAMDLRRENNAEMVKTVARLLEMRPTC